MLNWICHAPGLTSIEVAILEARHRVEGAGRENALKNWQSLSRDTEPEAFATPASVEGNLTEAAALLATGRQEFWS
jgi:hypothetical protein